MWGSYYFKMEIPTKFKKKKKRMKTSCLRVWFPSAFCISNSWQFPLSLHWVCQFNMLVKTTMILPLFNLCPATKIRRKIVNILSIETKHLLTAFWYTIFFFLSVMLCTIQNQMLCYFYLQPPPPAFSFF